MSGQSEESIQLISSLEGKFAVTQQGREWLKQLEGPLAVVSIAGMYRTGKSYLVNRLIRPRTQGFRTAASSQPVTKGLHVWNRPIEACDSQGRPMHYLVLDSEGTGSCQQQLQYDSQLMALVFLVSSTVIFNSVGPIDEQALQQLRVVTHLRHCLNQQEEQHKTKLAWVLRDFALQLSDKYGTDISPDQYLRNCLADCPATTIDAKRKNEVRRALRDSLGLKKCFTLVRPTIREDDLADLTKTTLRPEFLEEIEKIREWVFSGSSEDLKRLDGRPLTGRLLLGLLEACVAVLNGPGLPALQSAWQGIRTRAEEEQYEALLASMTKEVRSVQLPLIKSRLRLKLNQVQNKYYCRLEEAFPDGASFRKYHRMFLQAVQKLNREIKADNQHRNQERALGQLRQFVRDNLSFAEVEPTNLSLVRTLVDRMELRTRGQLQGYQYVLSVLFDLMRISETKSIRVQEELSQQLRMRDIFSAEKKNSDLNNLSLKQDYHEALRTITQLKLTQEENQQQLALAKQELEAQRLDFENKAQEWDCKEAGMIRKMEENSQRARQKAEETSLSLKRLREENTAIFDELSHLREEKMREGLNERKELIFEEKIRENWERFDQERKNLQAEHEALQRQLKTLTDQYDEERRLRERQAEQFARQKEVFTAKERQFAQQLRQIQQLHQQAKKTYSATVDTLQDNQRIFRSIQNVSLSSSKRSVQRDDRRMQQQITQHQQQARGLREEVQRLKQVCQQQRDSLRQLQGKLQQSNLDRQKVQRQLALASSRFADTLSEVENAKERERSLYEESIVRLLNTMDKRESLGIGRRH